MSDKTICRLLTLALALTITDSLLLAAHLILGFLA